MEIEKITITQLQDLHHPSDHGYWADLDGVLSSLVERDGYSKRLAVEIQVVRSPQRYTTLDEMVYLPTFCANPKGQVKFVY